MEAVVDDCMRDMKKLLATGALALAFGSALAQTSITLDFNGSGNDLAATGFNSVLNEDTTGYMVGGGTLSITTLPGDIYGNYENDPDDAKNVFSSTLDMTGGTIVNAHVTVSGLNENFHGGGIWMGLDTDHYIRLGVINAGTDILVEGIRENEELWNNPSSGHNGPGGDIVGIQSSSLGTTPQSGSLDLDLRLARTGSSVDAFYSLDGVTYTLIGNFTDLQIAAGSFTESSALSVGVYAFGGPVGQSPATLAFDSFSAEAVPEPASMAALALGVAALIRRRKA